MDPFLAAARATFRQQQRAFETLIAGLPAAGGAQIEAALDAIDPATLGGLRIGPSTRPSSDEEYTGARCVLHAVEHTQEHLGQAYLTRELWEARRSGR